MADLVVELLLRRLYETERKLPNRNFAKGHSFEEWCYEQRRMGRDDNRKGSCEGHPKRTDA
jgi:hypothetical protein